MPKLQKDLTTLEKAIEMLKSANKSNQVSKLERYAANMDKSFKEVTEMK